MVVASSELDNAQLHATSAWARGTGPRSMVPQEEHDDARTAGELPASVR
jgi:hypothetical protein